MLSGCRYIQLNVGQAKCKPDNDFEINEKGTLEGLRLCPCMGGMHSGEKMFQITYIEYF